MVSCGGVETCWNHQHSTSLFGPKKRIDDLVSHEFQFPVASISIHIFSFLLVKSYCLPFCFSYIICKIISFTEHIPSHSIFWRVTLKVYHVSHALWFFQTLHPGLNPPWIVGVSSHLWWPHVVTSRRQTNEIRTGLGGVSQLFSYDFSYEFGLVNPYSSAWCSLKQKHDVPLNPYVHTGYIASVSFKTCKKTWRTLHHLTGILLSTRR